MNSTDSGLLTHIAVELGEEDAHDEASRRTLPEFHPFIKCFRDGLGAGSKAQVCTFGRVAYSKRKRGTSKFLSGKFGALDTPYARTISER